MRFPYRQYISRDPGSSDYRLILRPIVPIRISGPRSQIRWDALVDSGADETLLPLKLAEILGVDLDPQLLGRAAGVGGHELTILYGDVWLQLDSEDECVEWKTTVGFVNFGSTDEEVIILGHGGCLDYFTVTFYGESAELELTPNSLLPT